MTGDEERKRPIKVTREELYRQVWETPMSRLAVQYGITGKGLAKICDRLEVPYPPRGYWAKKAAGKKTVAYQLPTAHRRTQQSVTVTPTPSPASPSELPTGIQKQVEKARVEAAAITVQERLVRPHAIIAGWLADHQRRKQEARRERDPVIKRIKSPGEPSDADRRRYRVLNSLLKELERQGGRVEENERRALFVELQGERIEFQIREKQKQVRRPLNDDEKRWRLAGDKGWRQELQPTGRLLFSIMTYLPDGLRREWLETDAAQMEALLPDIVATFVTAAPLLVEQRRQREEAERERQVLERQRYEEQQRRRLEQNRWRRFVEIACEWRDVQTARAFLDALKMVEMDLMQEIAGNTVADWLAWADASFAHADPLNRGADVIFGEVAKVAPWTYRD